MILLFLLFTSTDEFPGTARGGSTADEFIILVRFPATGKAKKSLQIPIWSILNNDVAADLAAPRAGASALKPVGEDHNGLHLPDVTIILVCSHGTSGSFRPKT